MKKLFVLIALVAFIGVLAAPVTAAYSSVTVEMSKELKADDKKADQKTEKKADDKKSEKADCEKKSDCCKTKCDGDKKEKKSSDKK